MTKDALWAEEAERRLRLVDSGEMPVRHAADVLAELRKSRRGVLESVRKSAKAKAAPGASAARSQDFLYDADGFAQMTSCLSKACQSKGARLGRNGKRLVAAPMC